LEKSLFTWSCRSIWCQSSAFPVAQQRKIKTFDALSEKISPRVKEVSIEEQEAWMYAQGPQSPELITYVKQIQISMMLLYSLLTCMRQHILSCP
jgi:hypothetical protein